MVLAPRERLRGIFHPTQHHFHMDSTGAIEQWETVEDALETFRRRAEGQGSATHCMGQEPGWEDGYEVGETACMDVWIADADEEPGVPDAMWQRWRANGDTVRRENF